jgi:hypothetical protein
MGQKIKMNNMKGISVQKNPNIWVVSPHDRGRKSIKSNNIYLKDGEEFQLEIWNPLNKSILVDIHINGDSISDNGLVIRPGQRIYLDCFPHNRKKFVFNTYEVDQNPESLEAIEKNGIIEAFFYKEDSVISEFKKIIKDLEKWVPTYLIYPTYPIYPIYPQVWYTNNTQLNSENYNQANYQTSYIETGRVEGGDKSSQNFIEFEGDFQSSVLNVVKYKILPVSRKPIEIDDKIEKLADKLSKKFGQISINDREDWIEFVKSLQNIGIKMRVK